MKARVRLLSTLLALVLLLAAGLPAAAEKEEQQADVNLLMALDVARKMDLKDGEGKPLIVRKAEEMTGRGKRGKGDPIPDYTGVMGYVALQNSWEVTQFSTFAQTPWQLPWYQQEEGGKYTVTGIINHKTPVLVIGQDTNEGLAYTLHGYLQVVRLDTEETGWIDVAQFATVPYWTLPLHEAYEYGCCIAAYREKSRYLPIDRKGRRGPLPDDIRVLVFDKTSAFRIPSRDKANNPILGIIFRDKKGTDAYFRTFLRFNEEDLKLVY